MYTRYNISALHWGLRGVLGVLHALEDIVICAFVWEDIISALAGVQCIGGYYNCCGCTDDTPYKS